MPADGDVLSAASLLTDESSLTGESVPVEKAPGGDPSHGTVSAGTVVVHGRGRVAVTATGAHSALGRIAPLMGAAPGPTPLQRRLADFGRVLAAVIVALCGRVFGAHQHHALAGPAREAGQGQTLQDAPRVGLHQQPVGVRTRIALVPVGDHHGPGVAARRLPFRRHAEAGTAASPEPGRRHLTLDLFRSAGRHRPRPHLPGRLTGEHAAQQDRVAGVVDGRDPRRPRRLPPRELSREGRPGTRCVAVERSGPRIAVAQAADGLHRHVTAGRGGVRGDAQYALHLREVPSAPCGEARRRGAHPHMTVAVRGGEVRVVTGGSQRGGSRQAGTGGDSRRPALGAARCSGPGLGQGLDQPVSRPPTPVRQRPEGVEGASGSDERHAFIVGKGSPDRSLSGRHGRAAASKAPTARAGASGPSAARTTSPEPEDVSCPWPGPADPS